MTNLEKINYISKTEDTADVAAVRILIGQIMEDVSREVFNEMYYSYPDKYKAAKKWLESEVQE